MHAGVPQSHQSPPGDPRSAVPRGTPPSARRAFQAGTLVLGLLCTLLFVPSAVGATASVGLGTAASFSVLGGSTVTNTGPTTMFGDLGLAPGSSVTGAPHVLGQTHIADAVAIEAKNALTTGYNDAASRASNGSAGTDLAGQTFTPGVRTASSSLLLSSGAVTLNALGDPNAVFVFQIATTLITEANTEVLLVNGAQACNVFWQVGSSATLATGTRFVGTIMALATITAKTAATIHGRLLARTGAVNMDTNTITTSSCPSSESGNGGGTESTTGPTTGGGGAGTTTTPTTGASRPPIGSRTTGTHGKTNGRNTRRHKRHAFARTALPHHRGSFTG